MSIEIGKPRLSDAEFDKARESAETVLHLLGHFAEDEARRQDGIDVFSQELAYDRAFDANARSLGFHEHNDGQTYPVAEAFGAYEAGRITKEELREKLEGVLPKSYFFDGEDLAA